MSRGGAVFPASQGFYCDRATKRTGLLPVEPEAEAFFTEHVLRGQKDTVTVRSVPTCAHSDGSKEGFQFSRTMQLISSIHMVRKINPSITSTSVCQSWWSITSFLNIAVERNIKKANDTWADKAAERVFVYPAPILNSLGYFTGLSPNNPFSFPYSLLHLFLFFFQHHPLLVSSSAVPLSPSL